MTVPPSTFKRRRVSRACESCQDPKAKVSRPQLLFAIALTDIPHVQCDGNRPTCGRCAGYGYACLWRPEKRRKPTTVGNRAEMDLFSTDAEVRKMRDAINIYDSLIRSLRGNLSENDRRSVDLALTIVPVSEYGLNLANSATAVPSPERTRNEIGTSSSFQRYLGEASDIRFFHTMKSALSERTENGHQPDILDREGDSYEQEELRTQCLAQKDHGFLPTRANADRFVDIYFSTIHIAYPFISQTDFRRTYDSFWSSESLEGFRGSWLSLLCKPPSIFFVICIQGFDFRVLTVAFHHSFLSLGPRGGPKRGLKYNAETIIRV